MPRAITKITAHDVRFPTSRDLDGSDAMNQAPDYSAAFALVETDADDGLVGYGMTFTIGRGNEICVMAIESLAPFVIGRTLEDPQRRHLLLAPRESYRLPPIQRPHHRRGRRHSHPLALDHREHLAP